MATQKELRRLRIRRNIRSKVVGSPEKPRLSVFRSNTTIYAQLIDDATGKTLASASSTELAKGKSANITTAKEVGKKVAEIALSSGISAVVFDRGGYLYHGKVKALAEGAREGGLKF
ncbi:50S ribosomal protein L18 [Cytophagaceae bacterium DM2B3-1]|uniref:Large ribosomal subunit protein uL18 n=2 Tax=Xanthocytophaga TaxID=3078918 RepID=A0ABT7CG86_9BACT|nr:MULTISPECIES: 50S ribosomal protein L18 [Xanthocytophaga]MDJ1466702.1 50S ribosomal protein L18 [Xanthocytophaga flavus]MDJ1492698.1 50S ribosomal protein L18 [Xanthocytophaga flavus]MDJ1500918.1 50S ribosomal protein L18 [Xanthocytophaga agilis]